MVLLRVSGLELVEDGNPPIVRCSVVDVAGRVHAFVDKLPIFAGDDWLDAGIGCSFVDVRRDEQGRRVVTVDCACPWGLESSEGVSVLEVFEEQLGTGDEAWIRLNGVRMPAARFGTNDGLNYGRQVDDGLVYQAELPIEGLGWFASSFAAMVDELRDDDERFGDPTAFAGCEYRRSLAEAALFPEALAEGIAGYCHIELLAHHFPFAADACEFVINSTDAVFVVADQIIIRGRCWSRDHKISKA